MLGAGETVVGQHLLLPQIALKQQMFEGDLGFFP